ncbi:Tetratricopeptide repeat-containing protein [Dyadobacter soli]|uniref:Tetratricopeptide repeat-containing protein n=1 Tax=Dyadobacter soli TaxID=659014 RepID=A0A1G7TCQ5_9BACT|nr:tetratricopeptide repeat protein [Dyadobacter soli]SDG32380.1 Tetratricopeptide repeat-containing protein [Dyadobacter soli]
MTLDELLKSLRNLNDQNDFSAIANLYDNEGLPEGANASILTEYAIAFRELGRFFECDDALQQALTLNPKHKRAKSIARIFEQDERRYQNKQKSITSPRYISSYYNLGVKNYNSGNYGRAIELLKIVSSIAPDFETVFEIMGQCYLKLGDIKAAKKTFKLGISYGKSVELFIGLSEVYQRLDKMVEASDTIERAMKTYGRTEKLMFEIASIHQKQKEYAKSNAWFNRIARKNEKNALVFMNLGINHLFNRNHEDALDNFEKAAFILSKSYLKENASPNDRSNLAACYAYRGNAFRALESYEEAISSYTQAIALLPDNFENYYNRALVYSKLSSISESDKAYEYMITAYSDFERAWINIEETDTYFSVIVEIFNDELQRYRRNDQLFRILLVINKIRNLLATEGRSVAHFTSLSVAKNLILNDSKFRLSEGTFLNDTSEGTELSRYLEIPNSTIGKFERVIDKKFLPKWFIGSFVQESETNDLTLWRMYGKEGADEAQGCSITVNSNKLLNQFNEFIYNSDKSYFRNILQQSSGENFDQDFVFFQVAYYQTSTSTFIVPTLSPEGNVSLNHRMNELKEQVREYYDKYGHDETEVYFLESLLSQIKYLFKTEDYKHEQEVRIIIRGGMFPKEVDMNFTPPKVYINTFPIGPCITKIVLGPKVNRADEWASAFYYHLEKTNVRPEIFISSLPFK